MMVGKSHLERVGDDACAQAACEEAEDALLFDDLLRGLAVADGRRRGLASGLEDAEEVGEDLRRRDGLNRPTPLG